jgi:hypothetical protein
MGIEEEVLEDCCGATEGHKNIAAPTHATIKTPSIKTSALRFKLNIFCAQFLIFDKSPL